ncbi:hypothetical protein EDD11_000285 [Mortierella claussenii]|nr:hypothetical protein EDD11_000285 [Mortierella claussenii]
MDAALRIAEIRLLIASFLGKKELRLCMQVCKQWTADFRALLWRDMTFTQKESYTMTKALVHKHGHLIRNLVVRDPIHLIEDWFTAPFCCNLVQVDFLPFLSRKRQLLAAPMRSTGGAAAGDSTNVPKFPDQDFTFLSMRSVEKACELIKCNSKLQGIRDTWYELSRAHSMLFMERLCDIAQEGRGLKNVRLIESTWWHIPGLDCLEALVRHCPKLNKLFLFQPVIEMTRKGWSLEDQEQHQEEQGQEQALQSLPSSTSLSSLLASTPTTAVTTSTTTTTYSADHTDWTIDLAHLKHLQLTVAKISTSSSSSSVTARDSTIHMHASELTALTLMGLEGSSLFMSDDMYSRSFLRRVRSWYCPKLQSLQLMQDETDMIHNANALFETAEQLKDLNITGCRLNSDVIRVLLSTGSELGPGLALGRHATSLESIKMSWSQGLTSSDLQLILTSCPHLRHFEGSADQLKGTDVIKSTWVCKQLETLVVFLDIPPLRMVAVDDRDQDDVEDREGKKKKKRNDELQQTMLAERAELYRAIYDQLAPLEQLTMIRFGGFSRGVKFTTGIPWTLKAGLDQLKRLSKMKTFYVTESIEEIGMEEVAWFKQYWPRLRTIRRLDDRSMETPPKVKEALGEDVEVF